MMTAAVVLLYMEGAARGNCCLKQNREQCEQQWMKLKTVFRGRLLAIRCHLELIDLRVDETLLRKENYFVVTAVTAVVGAASSTDVRYYCCSCFTDSSEDGIHAHPSVWLCLES